MSPSDPPTMPGSGSARAQIAAERFRCAQQAVGSRNFDYGIHLLLNCCKLDPSELIYRQTLRRVVTARYQDDARPPVRLSRGADQAALKAAKQVRNYREVLNYGERVLASNFSDVGIHLDMAEAAQALGLLDLAIWILEQARCEDSPPAKLHRRLARLHEQRGDLPRAIVCWERVSPADRNDREARVKVKNLMACETIARGHYGDAISDQSTVRSDGQESGTSIDTQPRTSAGIQGPPSQDHAAPDDAEKEKSRGACSLPAAQPCVACFDPLPKLFGRYRLIEGLGHGGMGSVYLAEDAPLGRLVAVKIPRFRVEDSPEMVKRFDTEARAAAAIHHPNICVIHDAGFIDNTPYIAMAYVAGRPLSRFIRRGKFLAQRPVAALVRRVALALQEAHNRGVLHRDLKPSNIIINKRGEPVIVDFGLAFRMNVGDVRSRRSDAVVGTPVYASPEQLDGDVETLGPACDIYSLSVILYELLTARVPFEGSLRAIALQQLRRKPKPPSRYRSDVDPKLEAICLKAMAKRVERRFASMDALAEALTHYLRRQRAQSQEEP